MPITDVVSTRGVLLGITTPVSGIGIPDLGNQVVLAVVSTRDGIISADMSSGAQIRGSGSRYMTMSGTTPQIAATLATLAYVNPQAGLDQLSVALITPSGTILPVAATTLAILPLASPSAQSHDLVRIDRGTLTLESRTLDGPDLQLEEPAGSRNATSVILINSTIGASSQLTVRNDNALTGTAPRVAVAGRVELDGATVFRGNGTAVSLARGATLLNKGAMTIDGGPTRIAGAGTFVNHGTIDILAGGSIDLAGALTGTGTVTLAAGATLRLSAEVGADETIRLGGGANILRLTHPGSFAGTIAGFSGDDTLVLDGIAAPDAVYTPMGDRGVLTVFDGTLPVARIRFEAPETSTVFHLAVNGTGSATLSLAAINPGTVDVFRFFDAAHGTQFLTQDAAERDAILSKRADLRFEGVGLHAVDPAHAASSAVEVYRFFDSGNGTHFLTSSTTERDIVLSSRPDLVFEPNSTMIEHSVAQPGDRAVFRFFDTTNGGHFYTADAGERATIVANRPDMSLEGIAFYAPSA